MKQLISQSKKLLTYNVPALLCLALFLSTNSCELVDSKELTEEFKPHQVNLILKNNGQQLIIGAKSCLKGLQEFEFSLLSPYGSHKVKLSTPSNTSLTGSSVLSLDEQKFLLTDWELLSSATKKLICQAPSVKSHTLPHNQELSTHLLSKLQTIVPMCHFSFYENSLRCSMKQTDYNDLNTTIQSFEKKLFRLKPRHPYVLARRIAITRKLFQAVSSQFPLDIDDICRIVSLSSKEELPLPLRSKIWLTSCQQQSNTTKDQFLHTTLTEAIGEASYLLSAFQDTSTGVLTVRIPLSQVNYRNFWVRLTPQKIDKFSAADDKCFWHPLYPAATLEKYVYAQIFQDKLKNSCVEIAEPITAENIHQILQRYIGQSISSETEFPISNGRGKVLTLPPGSYKYELRINRAPFAAPLQLPPPQQLTEGTLRWRSPRAYPVISDI